MAKTRSKVRESSGIHGCWMWGFFGIFFIVGLGLFTFMSVLPIWQIWQARSWIETTCTIETSEVEVVDGDDGDTYKVAMTYGYRVDGQFYDGERYDFSWGSTSGYDGKREIVVQHPPGADVACFFDPEDPAMVVIQRGPGTYLWWGLFPLPFLGVGTLGLLWLFFAAKVSSGSISSHAAAGSRTRSRARSTRITSARPIALSAALAGHGAQDDLVRKVLGIDEPSLTPPLQRGPVEFSGEKLVSNRRIAAKVLTGVAAILGVAAYFWPFPMLLIALIVGGMAVYFWMKLFNPVPSAQLAESYLVPGSATEVGWQFKGAAKRIRKLVVSLEGRESATYRRGTSTYTDHHVFHEQPLAVEKGPQPRMFGKSTLEIPADTMPSFSSDNNRISWRIRFRVDVERWPDVDEDFEISVFPPTGEEGLS